MLDHPFLLVQSQRFKRRSPAGNHFSQHGIRRVRIEGSHRFFLSPIVAPAKNEPNPPAGPERLYALAGSIVTSSPCWAILRISSVIFIEQYFGPHMLQKWADLKVSCGSV